jgi:hypothetical protein
MACCARRALSLEYWVVLTKVLLALGGDFSPHHHNRILHNTFLACKFSMPQWMSMWCQYGNLKGHSTGLLGPEGSQTLLSCTAWHAMFQAYRTSRARKEHWPCH